MTSGRRAALVIGVPLCLAVIGSSGLSLLENFAQGKYPVSYSIPASTRALTVNTDGGLTIKSVGTGQAALTGTAHYTFVRPSLTHQVAGDATTIGYNCTIALGDCELDGTVGVPSTVTALTAHIGSGDADVTGMTGPVTLSSGDGNLSVSHTSGPLTLNTGSGTVQVSAITAATLSASTGDGDITGTGITSPTVAANSDSGNITLGASGGTPVTLTASTGSGDIQIKFTGAPPQTVHVNTDSGDVVILLPPGSGTKYNFSTNTDSGSVSYPTSLENKASANVITASSGSGDITISQE